MEFHDQENLYSTTGRSSFHFNSFLGLLTSDDDEEEDDNAADIDPDTFIEIALEPQQIPFAVPSPPQLQDEEDRSSNNHEEELQFRVSFSSRVFPFPGQSSLCSSDGVDVNNISGPHDQEISSDDLHAQGKPRIKFRAAMDRLLGFFPSTFNISSTPPSWELLAGSRGQANCRTTTAGKSRLVGNFLVKLRARTFQMMMTSFLNLRHFASATPERTSINQQLTPRNAQMLIAKPFRTLVGRMQNISRKSRKIGSKTSEVSDMINLKGRRLDGGDGGVFSLKRAISSRKWREKKAKSCPSSVRSSPSKEQCFSYELVVEEGGGSSRNQNMHFARDNSVQAAIAHCKKSLGGADDFHF